MVDYQDKGGTLQIQSVSHVSLLIVSEVDYVWYN